MVGPKRANNCTPLSYEVVLVSNKKWGCFVYCIFGGFVAWLSMLICLLGLYGFWYGHTKTLRVRVRVSHTKTHTNCLHTKTHILLVCMAFSIPY